MPDVPRSSEGAAEPFSGSWKICATQAELPVGEGAGLTPSMGAAIGLASAAKGDAPDSVEAAAGPNGMPCVAPGGSMKPVLAGLATGDGSMKPVFRALELARGEGAAAEVVELGQSIMVGVAAWPFDDAERGPQLDAKEAWLSCRRGAKGHSSLRQAVVAASLGVTRPPPTTPLIGLAAKPLANVGDAAAAAVGVGHAVAGMSRPAEVGEGAGSVVAIRWGALGQTRVRHTLLATLLGV